MDHTIASSSSASRDSTMVQDFSTKPGLTSGAKEVRSFDAVDDDIDLDYHGHLRRTNHDDGFTRTDAREMRRMGKKQELRVRKQKKRFSFIYLFCLRETSVLSLPSLSPSSFRVPGRSS